MTILRHLTFLLLLVTAQCFAPLTTPRASCTVLFEKDDGGIFGAVGNFFQELDAFVDDATSRRLGAGSAFYGKRKSSFYGKDDKNKKLDRSRPDPTEDYQGEKEENVAGYYIFIY